MRLSFIPKIILKTIPKIAITLALFLAARASSAEVLKIVVDDTIHPLIAEHVDRAIQEAQRTHADALLIEINTPGGMMSSMETIIQKLLAAPMPTIIYVTPSGGSASSAGFYILEAADVAAMAPGTNTGTAHPVLPGTTMDPVMKEKLENYAASLLRSYITKRGRNADVAETAVRVSKTFTAEEALAQHLIEYVAADETDLLRQMEGKTITRFDGSKVVLHLAGKSVRVYEPTVRERVLDALMNPNFMLLVLVTGLLAIYFEFNHPGAVIPGVVGFLAVLLVLYAIHFLPFSSMALVMIASSFVIFALEAKYQTHGVLGVAGVVIMTVGALLLIDGPIPQMRVKLWTALSVSIPLGAITIFLMTIALQARRNKVLTGEQGLVGEIGVARSPLLPEGKVFVHGELWNAVAATNLEAGSHVVVRKVENLVLHVDSTPGPVAPASHGV